MGFEIGMETEKGDGKVNGMGIEIGMETEKGDGKVNGAENTSSC